MFSKPKNRSFLLNKLPIRMELEWNTSNAVLWVNQRSCSIASVLGVIRSGCRSTFTLGVIRSGCKSPSVLGLLYRGCKSPSMLLTWPFAPTVERRVVPAVVADTMGQIYDKVHIGGTASVRLFCLDLPSVFSCPDVCLSFASSSACLSFTWLH